MIAEATISIPATENNKRMTDTTSTWLSGKLGSLTSRSSSGHRMPGGRSGSCSPASKLVFSHLTRSSWAFPVVSPITAARVISCARVSSGGSPHTMKSAWHA